MTTTIVAAAALLLAAVIAVASPLRFLGVRPDGEQRIRVTVGDTAMAATLADTRPAAAFGRLLRRRPVTVRMRDYASMEKVGMLWRWLPRQDRPTAVEPGDIVLFMGASLVIYYKPHTWSFTRLGTIDGVSADELRSLLGTGDVRVTFALQPEEGR